MNGALERWWLQAPARKLRIIGAIVLAGGLAGAYLFYWTHRSFAPTMDDLLPGYSQQRARQTAILMGGLVVTLLGWADVLREPSSQALIMAGASVLTAIACFRIAFLLDLSDRADRVQPNEAPSRLPREMPAADE